MVKLVKLILICQIKDDLIPQLIPLIWISSVFIVIFILLKLVNVYFYKRVDEIIGVDYVIKISDFKIKW